MKRSHPRILPIHLVIVAIIIVGIPSLNGAGVTFFGWDRWPGELTLAITAVGFLFSFIGAGLGIADFLRTRKPPEMAARSPEV